MQGVVLVTPAGYDVSRFARALRDAGWALDIRSDGELFIESDGAHAFLNRCDSAMQEYDQDEILKILGVIPNPIFFAVEFNDFEFGKSVLIKIANADNVVVDNEHGDILTGVDFVRRMREDREWDWRRQLPPSG